MFLAICIFIRYPSADVIYEDDFQTGTAHNWELESGWEITSENGNYLLYGSSHTWAGLERGVGWADYSLKFRLKVIQGTVHVNVRLSEVGSFNRYFVGFNRDGIYLSRQNGEQFTELAESTNPITLKEWHNVEVLVKDSRIQVVVDNRLSLDYTDSKPVRKGTIAFETLEGSKVYVDDILVCTFGGFAKESELQTVSPYSKGGPLSSDETWSGEIHVITPVVVPKGVTLTIEPGTIVKFQHYRGYKEIGKRGGLAVNGGTVKAIGTPNEQIWFTSDANEPINGDWQGISLVNSRDSIFDYVIVEYAQIGIEQFDSEVTVSNSIIRWNNSEGLYAERSNPVFKNNTIYSNAYHEIALEQYNDVRI
ncbi:DUF1080 domain-containing protein, partial [Candidatus Bipolaricaulota bacterium]|nr:DUF1080 domain-containing protein [Candidatus Bipolaricaulota bacterium]